MLATIPGLKGQTRDELLAVSVGAAQNGGKFALRKYFNTQRIIRKRNVKLKTYIRENGYISL